MANSVAENSDVKLMKNAEKNRRKYAKCKIRNILRVCIRENQQFTKGMICRAQMLSQEDETVREWWMMTLAKKLQRRADNVEIMANDKETK